MRISLGDAISNITATVGPAEGLSGPVQSYIQGSLQAQGIDPATATSAQIMAAYQAFAGQQTFANLAPVYGTVVTPSTGQVRGHPQPALSSAAPSLPSWVWLAGTGVLVYFLFRH